jgi:acetyl-CoA carboxylase beta subunit
MRATVDKRRFSTRSALGETRGNVVVVDVMSLPGMAGAVVSVLGPPVLGRAVAATAEKLRAMTVTTTPAARHFERLMLDSLARLV